ncbi:hypothetical protein PRNP1_006235 [Phytophthora ramorum]
MTVTASADVAWGVACKRCDALVARHSQLSFLMENSTAIHLTLDKTLLHDEQREAQPQAETGESWRVYSHAYVKPEIALVKIRTTNAYKRERLPFELCCVKCDAKVASEGFLDELDEPMLLLDSKACACVLDNQTPYGMAGGTKARKWGVILRQLQELKLPFRIQKLQELIAAGGVEEEKREKEGEKEEVVVPVVHPTEASIRSHFSPRAKMSQLRRYQVELTLSALLENTIVYLPTGCGKTLVAIKVMEEMRHLNPDKLVVFIVPTGPLVSQQAGYIRRESNFEVSGLSGQHSRTAAATSDPIEIGGETDAIVVTPQYFLNLMFNGRTKITDYSTVVFDEAHHATGSHPYCELLKNIATVDLQARPHILALTASPFGESVRETSGQIALNKLAKAFNASVNSPTIAADDLESSFIPKEAEWVTVEESEPEQKLREGIKRYIESFYAKMSRLMGGQVMPFEANYDTNDMELSQFLAKLRLLRVEAEKKAMGNSNGVEMTGIEKSKRPLSDLELILEHLQKVASSFYSLSIHGAGAVAESLRRIFGDLEAASSKKGKRTFALIRSAYCYTMNPALINFPLETFSGADISNRVRLVAECIQDTNFDHDSRAIVFVRRRKTAILLAKAMEALDVLRELNPTRFVGHNSYEGMSWEEEQRPTLDRFRQGRIRLLVATNVLEEGLDVPECSLVIQFDGVVGVTSLIQSRGRARHRDSRFIIFCSAVGMERNQRLVENEKRLVAMANTAASKLESKVAVERLMNEYPEELVPNTAVNTVGELTLPLRAGFDSMADKVYNIVLGGVFKGANKQLQMSILERCLLSDCSHFTNGFLPPEFFDALTELDEKVQEKALLSFHAHPGRTNIADQFSAYLHDERPMLEVLCSSSHLDVSASVYKVIVTPSRIIYCPPDPAPSNRVFRHWGSENFMYVYFRDDNMERLDYTSGTILERVRNVLNAGIEIPHVKGGHKFRFLGCSLSQVRNSSAIFTFLDHNKVRSWIGDLSQLASPAKYLKRLGQAFSSTNETFRVNQSVLDYPVKDIENELYTFTDGCGEIALIGAESIKETLHLGYTPSAFQIRLGGAKGVLVVSDLANTNVSREDSVVLRESMSKFKSNHTMLEIVACAGKSEAYLTRQSVLILNDLGINEEVFLEMQEEFLSDLRSFIASNDGAYFELKGVLPPSIIWSVDVLIGQLGVKVLVDDFLSSLARTIYHYRLANTVMRARIPIAKGRTLMGVADFTGTLAYGEVFVQYSETDEDTGIDRAVTLDSIDVAVHRSPCHHPGDIRVLRCRADVPLQLRQLKDCIVFPSQGPRPHPDECTGGDLDGDMFVVIWDKRLIPSRAQVQEPMTFDEESGGDTSPRGGEYHQSTDDEGLVDFYVHSIQDDILGVASNAHLALCDASRGGSFGENAKILAQICSKQVDSLRSEADLEIVRNLAPKSYPDFMQNKDKPSYPSSKVLGKMFRRCKAIFDTTMTKNVTQMPMRDDQFLTTGYTDYLNHARTLYRQYKLRLRALLLMSGAQTEAELATGMIVDPQSVYKADYFRFGEQCKDAFYAFQTSFRSQFDSDTSAMAPGENLKVAAACYFVAYDDSDAATRSLSFPWIVIDLLTTIKKANIGKDYYQLWNPVRLSAYAETIPKLQLCILAEITANTDELLADLFDRLVAVSSLRSVMTRTLKKKELDLILFGSSGLLTFEKQSDLDVMVRCRTSRGSLKAIAKALAGSYGNIDLKDDIRVPLLSFSFDQWSVEMCKLSNGPVKTRLFRTYMERYNFFWPCVYFLVRWGKCVGVIRRRSGGGHDMFSPTGFIWLFLRFCTEHNFVKPISAGTITLKDILKTNDIDTEISFWTGLLTRLVSGKEDVSALSAADVLLSFFSYYAKLSTPDRDYGFIDPLDPENDTQLEPEAVTLFRSECHIALHQLVIVQGDIKYLLTHREEQSSRITLSHALSTRVHEAKNFYSRKILFEMKANSSTRLSFKFHPNSLRSDLYVAEIIGPGDAVQRIEEHIRVIEQELGARMPYRSNRNFHHEGSSLLLFEGAESQHENIGFQDYFGERHGDHIRDPLHQAHLICFMNGRQWYEHAAATFCAKFIQQMIKLSRYEHLYPGASEAKAFVRFGHHYLINLPRSFAQETIMLASIKKLEDEFERGRTARELYEAVLIAKQKQRAQAEVENMMNQNEIPPEVNNQEAEGVWGEYSGEEQDGSEADADEGELDCDGGGGGGCARQRRRQRRPRMSLQKADKVARGDKGVTHSFYSMIEPQHTPWTKEYAEKRLGMTLVEQEESDTYQVSIVHQSFEYNIRLTSDLQLVKIKTRPSRWFSATLKMRQEMDDESHMMDLTPDVRFYVSTTTDMPKTDSLYVKLSTCCENAPDGRGIIEFCDDETRDKVRISRYLVDAGESSACIGTVRHVRGTKYYNSETETQLSLMHIREFTIPDRNPQDGFMSVRDKVEAEFLLPPLTPERRLQPTFARGFLTTGMEFVDFLRTQADMAMP